MIIKCFPWGILIKLWLIYIFFLRTFWANNWPPFLTLSYHWDDACLFDMLDISQKVSLTCVWRKLNYWMINDSLRKVIYERVSYDLILETYWGDSNELHGSMSVGTSDHGKVMYKSAMQTLINFYFYFINLFIL